MISMIDWFALPVGSVQPTFLVLCVEGAGRSMSFYGPKRPAAMVGPKFYTGNKGDSAVVRDQVSRVSCSHVLRQ